MGRRWRRAWRIGAGREAEVYAAVDLDSGELLAAKQWRAPRGDAAQREALARCRREAEIASRLPPHPHVVAHLGSELRDGDGGEDGGANVEGEGAQQLTVLMEFCAGGTRVVRVAGMETATVGPGCSVSVRTESATCSESCCASV